MPDIMKPLRAAACALALCASATAFAQAPAAAQPAPAVSEAGAPVPATGGPKGADIFSVGTEDTQAQRQKTQPLNNAPFWREVNSGKAHYSSLPGKETGVLIQHGGEAWRQLRNGPVTQIGGWALVAIVLAISAFFAFRGTIRVGEKPTGRKIERFTPFERMAHWSLAISFMALGLTGLAMLFGKHVVLPVLGHGFFSWIAIVAKNVHNFIGPLFAVSVLITFFTFVKDNLPRKSDIKWILSAGGLFTGKHASSHRFNAGEKTWFWGGVFLLGFVVSISGFVLDFPNFEQTRGQMQLAWTFHAIGALLFVGMSLGHIYIGSIGMEGAYQAMKTGYVDEAWAKEHHDEWYADIKAGRIPAIRSAGAQPQTPPASDRLAA